MLRKRKKFRVRSGRSPAQHISFWDRRIGGPDPAYSASPSRQARAAPNTQSDSSLVGALFNSQIAVAQLMYQFSPLQMITRQQAIILDTFTSALSGALEAPARGSKKGT